MSRPVPSPSMNGMMGRSGTRYLPLLYSMRCPSDGTGTPLNDAMHLPPDPKKEINIIENKVGRWGGMALGSRVKVTVITVRSGSVWDGRQDVGCRASEREK